LEVEFAELPHLGKLPFTASADDAEAHGRALYEAAINGEFGQIAPFE
jgi:hypothetical protein